MFQNLLRSHQGVESLFDFAVPPKPPIVPALADPMVAHLAALTGLTSHIPPTATPNEVLQAMLVQLLRTQSPPSSATSPILSPQSPLPFMVVDTTPSAVDVLQSLLSKPAYLGRPNAASEQLPLLTVLGELQQHQQRKASDAEMMQSVLQHALTLCGSEETAPFYGKPQPKFAPGWPKGSAGRKSSATKHLLFEPVSGVGCLASGDCVVNDLNLKGVSHFVCLAAGRCEAFSTKAS